MAASFWEHTIKDDDDLEKHVNYIQYNPVKHGLVTKVSDWPHFIIMSRMDYYTKIGLML